MIKNYTRIEDNTTVPAIPEPFWFRGLTTFFRSKPACYDCRIVFKNRAEWEEHWVKVHSVEDDAQ